MYSISILRIFKLCMHMYYDIFPTASQNCLKSYNSIVIWIPRAIFWVSDILTLHKKKTFYNIFVAIAYTNIPWIINQKIQNYIIFNWNKINFISCPLMVGVNLPVFMFKISSLNHKFSELLLNLLLSCRKNLLFSCNCVPTI